MPCVESLYDRCTWDLEFVVSRALYSSIGAASGDSGPSVAGEAEEEWPISVIASGELIEQVLHPTRSDRIIWHYALASPVSAQQIAWAVGPYVIMEIGKTRRRRAEEDDEEDDDDDEDEDGTGAEQTKVFGVCLPGREEELAYSAPIMRQALDFYSSNYGSFPFSTYTAAFVDSLDSGAPTFHSAALTLFGADILHPPAVIDQVYETRHLLAHAVAVQWSGVNLIPRTPSDSWLIIGIALHITSLFLRTVWGTNEYRFRLKKDVLRCVAADVQREPICVPGRVTVPEPTQLQFIALKAPLVLFILDRLLRKSGTSLGLDKVIPKIFLAAITGDIGSQNAMTFNAASTNFFQRTCRKACGAQSETLKAFFDQWVYSNGCPTFFVQATFNRKRMAVELNIKQECRAHIWSQSAPVEEHGHLRPMPLFDGHLTIRIHEADGTPYEHVLNISEEFKKYEVPFNTKYKRVRRNTKRYQARQAAATAAALGDADAQEDLGMIDLGFSLPMWEIEEEREKWRVADWSEEDDLTMSQATYEWIRIDADFEWIANIVFEQPDFMWISQLQRDRDVVAQFEAVLALARMPSAIVSSNLAKTVLVQNYCFRIRLEAVTGLITVSFVCRARHAVS